jgi:hypothetical protein
MLDVLPNKFRGGTPMPTGGGDAGGKKAKKKSKEQLEKELKRQGGSLAPPAPMTFEVIKPKRKEKF